MERGILAHAATLHPSAAMHPSVSQAEPPHYRAGQIIVHLAAKAPLTAPQQIAQSLGATILDQLPELHAFRLALPAGTSVRAAMARLQGDAAVSEVEPNAVFQMARVPNDPLYRVQSDYLSLINAPAAWNIQRGDPNVVVAVLDSGVDITHPDLAANIWTNPNASPNDGNSCGTDLHGCNFVDGALVDPSCHGASTAPAPNPDVTPDFWHGTFVAGVIGATGNNGTGVTGIAWHIGIMSVRVGDCTGPDSDSVASGILYAARNGARVINMSFGEDPGPDDVCHASSDLVGEAVQIAAQRYGAVMVAATGNGTSPDGFLGCVDYPAAYPQVIAVGASAPGDVRAPFSQYGPEVAVAAPGMQIVSTSTPRANQQPPNDLYRIEDGTSFAVPIVSGEAALLISQNHLLTPDMVRSLIEAGADPVSDGNPGNWAGAGRVDLAASLKLVPAAFYGTVQTLANIPDGSPVEAKIGQMTCATGTTFTVGGQTSYVLYVPPFAVTAGCGLPGAVVDLYANGVRGGAAIWQPKDIRVDLNLTGFAP